MRILVAGASGLIGEGCVRALVRRNHEVVGLFRNAVHVDRVKQAGAQPVVVDLDTDAVTDAAKDCDAIIHAAQMEYYTKRLSTSFVAQAGAVDRGWTRKLLEAGSGRAKTFIYMSGSWVYGATGDELAEEDRPLHCFAGGAYKPESERIAIEEGRRQGYASVVAVRPGIVYGMGGVFKDRYIDVMLRGKKASYVGSGHNWASFVHRDDVGELCALVIERATGFGAVNVADDEPIQLRAALGYLAAKLGAPPPRGVPAWIVQFFIGHAARALASSLKIDSAKAKTQFGWNPRYPTYREGFAAVVAEAQTAATHAGTRPSIR